MRGRSLFGTENSILEYTKEWTEEDGGYEWHTFCFDVRTNEQDFKLWIYFQICGHSLTFLWW